MRIVHTFTEARELHRGTVGLVPTMGYLHEGHLSLAAGAVDECDSVVMSVFVNPLQFGPGEDLERYPRDLDRDAALAADAGVSVLFAPSLAEMYAEKPAARVSVPDLAAGLDGRARPGHFDGVAMVVTKLLAGLRPDRAYFGRKDAQQLSILRRLVLDLSFPTEVVGMPIMREHDGLALSSRNIYLAPAHRFAALALSRGLFAASDAVGGGLRDAATLEAIAFAEMTEQDLVEPEYVELTDAATVTRLGHLDRPSFLAVAARVGETRLIDNVHFDVADGAVIPDRGIRLTQPSVLYRQR